MSKLASKIAASPEVPALVTKKRPGPTNVCFPLYGEGDLEDFEQIEALRATPQKDGRLPEWREVQAKIDAMLGITTPIHLEKFRYHWRRRCGCWPEDLRR